MVLFNAELYNGKSFKGKIFTNMSGVYNIGTTIENPQLNFGYFDKGFINLLKSYQEYKKIPMSGILDSKTLKSIKNDIYSKTCGSEIKNRTGLELTKEEENELVNQEWNILLTKLKETQEMPKPSQPKDLLPENQKKLKDKMQFYLDTEFSESDTIEIIDELNFELQH